MEAILKDYLSGIRLGDSRVFKNLQVFPLFNDQGGMLDYLALKEAYDSDFIKVTEISDRGSVPELKVLNRARQPVLLLDGEELTGAKQNRVLNTSILVPKESELVVNVSCTEKGRWSYTSPEFSDSGVVMASEIRKKKTGHITDSLEMSRGYTSNQHEIWQDINELSASTGVFSDTGALKAVYESKESELKEIADLIPMQPDQKGVLVAVNGEITGFDILSRASVYQFLHEKLLKSYALQIMNKSDKEAKPLSSEKARGFIIKAGECSISKYKSTGLGWDFRLKGEYCTGSGLVHKDELIHIALFYTRRTPKAGPGFDGYKSGTFRSGGFKL